jgi:crossover junction endodeoxyribonuclease RuvC
MIQTLLTFTEKPETSDATDAVAAAVCHYFQANPKQFGQNKDSSGGGWKQFVTNNPDKIKRG